MGLCTWCSNYCATVPYTLMSLVKARQRFFIWAAAAVGTLLILIVIIVVASAAHESEPLIPGREALLNVPLIVGHNDFPDSLRTQLQNQINNFDLNVNLTNVDKWKNCTSCATDLLRLKVGKVGAQFWSAYVSCESQYKDAVAKTLEQIDVIKRFVRKYPNDLQLVTSTDGIMQAFEDKKVGSLIGVEGGHSIDSRIGVLRMFYDLGVRYMTLTHTCDTPWASSASNETSKNLTNFGMKIIHEMNRLGMMIDLSHVSEEVMLGALEGSFAPVIFSHSNAYTKFNHIRNVKDEVLKKLKTNGGIIMVNFYAKHLTSNDTNASIKDVLAHINYIVEQIGVDYVGIGSDFDGYSTKPGTKGLEDVSKFPDLFDALREQNSSLWTIINLEKLAGRNLLRVFKAVEEVRDKSIGKLPIEDWIPANEIIVPPDNSTCHTDKDVTTPTSTTNASATTPTDSTNTSATTPTTTTNATDTTTPASKN